MSDAIDRQAAIDAMHQYSHFDDFDQSVIDEETAVIAIKELPPVQPEQDAFTKWAKSVADRYRPERKKGKWIFHTTYLEHDCTIQYEVCSQCGKPKPRKLFDNDFSYEVNYCVACGSDMRGEP